MEIEEVKELIENGEAKASSAQSKIESIETAKSELESLLQPFKDFIALADELAGGELEINAQINALDEEGGE